jgi:hypothetical protein
MKPRKKAKAKPRKKTPAKKKAAKRLGQVYLPKRGSRLNKAQAQLFGEVIERLRTYGDGDIAKSIVDEARSPRSPLHDFFEWNDTKAAEAYRRSQARQYVRSIEVKITRMGTTLQTRAFVPTYRQGGGEVTNIGTALSDVDLMRRLLAEAQREADIFRRRFETLRSLAELSGLFAALDSFLDAAE